MTLDITTSTSSSRTNFYVDVAPEVDKGTLTEGFRNYPVPLEKFWDNTSNYATAAHFPTLCNKDNEKHKTTQKQKMKK
jgi:hypothetical protein